MGGESKTEQTQTSSLAPWAPASGALTGAIGGLGGLVKSAGLNSNTLGALDSLIRSAAAGNPFTSALTSGTFGLLNGGGATNNDAAISQNLSEYRDRLAPTANGSNIGGNSALKGQLDQIATDVTDRVNGAWAAAGRDGSPGNAQALARGIAAGVAPVIAGQYNADADRAMGAATSAYNAGTGTYGMLNANRAQSNANFQNGVGASGAALDATNWGPNAMLEAEARRFGIPAQQYLTLLGAVAPVAAQFGTQSGTSTGTTQMSGAQQFATIAGGVGSLWPKGNISFGG